jgi:hypothetical protein
MNRIYYLCLKKSSFFEAQIAVLFGVIFGCSFQKHSSKSTVFIVGRFTYVEKEINFN